MNTVILRLVCLAGFTACISLRPSMAQSGFIFHDCWHWQPGQQQFVRDIASDASGNLWVSRGWEIVHHDGNNWISIVPPGEVLEMEFDDLGRLWIQCYMGGMTYSLFRLDGVVFQLQNSVYLDQYTQRLTRGLDGSFWISNCRYVMGTVDTCLQIEPAFGTCSQRCVGHGLAYFEHSGCGSCNNLCSELLSSVNGFSANTMLTFCDDHQYPILGGTSIAVDHSNRFWAFHTYASNYQGGVYVPCTAECISKFENGNWTYYTDTNAVFDEVLFPNNLPPSYNPDIATPYPDSDNNLWGIYHHLFKMDSNGSTTIIPNHNHIRPYSNEVYVDANNTVWFGGIWDSAGIAHYGLISYQQPGCNVLTYNVPAHICSGETYQLGNTPLSTSGYYEATLQNTYGCDSIVHLTLTVHDPLPVTGISATICANETFNFHGNLLNNSGVYQHMLSSVYGCDSLIQLSLNVLPVSSASVNAHICETGSYNFFGQTLTTSGTYVYTTTSANGCDSVVTLQLTVHTPQFTSINATICSNEQFNFNGSLLNTSGSYMHTLPSMWGCDSIIQLTLNVNSVSSSFLSEQICDGETYYWNGQPLTASGFYFDTISNQFGCDSTLTLSLAVYIPTLSVIEAQILQGDSYNFNGTQLTQPGTYYDTLMNAEGCDSIVKLELSYLISVSALYDAASQLKVWPNPANELLYIDWPSTHEGATVSVLNLMGETVIIHRLSTPNHHIRIGHLPAGLYVIEAGGTRTRFTKQ